MQEERKETKKNPILGPGLVTIERNTRNKKTVVVETYDGSNKLEVMMGGGFW